MNFYNSLQVLITSFKQHAVHKQWALRFVFKSVQCMQRGAHIAERHINWVQRELD